MEIKVRFFASLTDITGLSETTLILEDGADVERAFAALCERWPALKPRLDSLRPAVNAKFCEGNRTLSNNDELALIPPVSGG
ncbi:MAG: MoaD/ThiS family protein [Planctomycetes bacterium]|nr:MoaD/ThiS family protein [Planctomycetota bacterium]